MAVAEEPCFMDNLTFININYYLLDSHDKNEKTMPITINVVHNQTIEGSE